MNWIVALLPDQALVLVIALIGLALICGLITGRRAGSLLGGIVLLVLLSPFIEALVAALPWWLLLGLLLVCGLSLLRALSGLLIGAHATSHMVGILAADVVRFGFRAVFLTVTLPFRMLGWLFRVGY
jgi:hypothetical protein